MESGLESGQMLATHDFDCEVEEFSSSDEQDFQSEHDTCASSSRYTESEEDERQHAASSAVWCCPWLYLLSTIKCDIITHCYGFFVSSVEQR